MWEFPTLNEVILLGIVILVVLLFGPLFLGYHRGVTLTDLFTHAHCMRLVGSVWCKQ